MMHSDSFQFQEFELQLPDSGDIIKDIWGNPEGWMPRAGLGYFLEETIKKGLPLYPEIDIILTQVQHSKIELKYDIFKVQRELANRIQKLLQQKGIELSDEVSVSFISSFETLPGLLSDELSGIDAETLSRLTGETLSDVLPENSVTIPDYPGAEGTYRVVMRESLLNWKIDKNNSFPLFIARHNPEAENPEAEQWIPLLPFLKHIEHYYIGDLWWCQSRFPLWFPAADLILDLQKATTDEGTRLIARLSKDEWTSLTGYFYQKAGVWHADRHQTHICTIYRERQQPFYLKLGRWIA